MTADLQDLFDRAGRNPPSRALDADAVLDRARAQRTRNRRIASAVAAAVAVVVALGVGLASERLSSTDPEPVAPHPTEPELGSLGSLAYALDGDIYVADGDGSNPVRIADGAPVVGGNCGGYWTEGPMWSPDGRYLAYRGSSTGDVRSDGVYCDRTVNISDQAGHHVASFPGEGWAISWSPDSTRVAAWVDFYPGTQIGIYGVDGERQALLTVPPYRVAGDFDPEWSPDGGSLLIPGGVEVPVDGSTPRSLPGDDPRSQWMAAYSPDGAEIAFVSPIGLGVAAADGSQARVLVPGGPDDFPGGPASLAWSPTGDRIAFVSRASGESSDLSRPSELSVLDVTSGSVVVVADLGGANLFNNITFSPEGDQILFTTSDGLDGPSLWSVQADGSNPRRLVAGAVMGDWQHVFPTP